MGRTPRPTPHWGSWPAWAAGPHDPALPLPPTVTPGLPWAASSSSSPAVAPGPAAPSFVGQQPPGSDPITELVPSGASSGKPGPRAGWWALRPVGSGASSPEAAVLLPLAGGRNRAMGPEQWDGCPQRPRRKARGWAQDVRGGRGQAPASWVLAWHSVPPPFTPATLTRLPPSNRPNRVLRPPCRVDGRQNPAARAPAGPLSACAEQPGLGSPTPHLHQAAGTPACQGVHVVSKHVSPHQWLTHLLARDPAGTEDEAASHLGAFAVEAGALLPGALLSANAEST